MANGVSNAPQAGGATGPAGGDLTGTYPNPTIPTSRVPKIEQGTVDFGSSGIALLAGQGTGGGVVFSPSFTSVPIVTTAIWTTAVQTVPLTLTIWNVSTTGFSWNLQNTNATGGVAGTIRGIQWIANGA